MILPVGVCVCLGIFQVAAHDEHGGPVARRMAFVALLIGKPGLLLTNRSMTSSAFRVFMRPDLALLFGMITTMAALILSVSVRRLRGLFGFAPLGWRRSVEAAGALVCIVVNEPLGLLWRRAAGKFAERKARQ